MSKIFRSYFETRNFKPNAINELVAERDCFILSSPCGGDKEYLVSRETGRIISDIYRVSHGAKPLACKELEAYPDEQSLITKTIMSAVEDCKLDGYKKEGINMGHMIVLAALKYLPLEPSHEINLSFIIQNTLCQEKELTESLMQSETLSPFTFYHLLDKGFITRQAIETFMSTYPDECPNNLIEAAMSSSEQFFEELNYLPFSLVGKFEDNEGKKREVDDIIKAYTDADGIVNADVVSALINNKYLPSNIRNDIFDLGCNPMAIRNFTAYIVNSMYSAITDGFFEESENRDSEEAFEIAESMEFMIRSCRLSEARYNDIWARIKHEKLNGNPGAMRNINLQDVAKLIAINTKDEALLSNMIKHKAVPSNILVNPIEIDGKTLQMHPLLTRADVYKPYVQLTGALSQQKAYATLMLHGRSIDKDIIDCQMAEKPSILTLMTTIINPEVSNGKAIVNKVVPALENPISSCEDDKDLWRNVAECLIDLKFAVPIGVRHYFLGLAMQRLYENCFSHKKSGTYPLTYAGAHRIIKEKRHRDWLVTVSATFDVVQDAIENIIETMRLKGSTAFGAKECEKAMMVLLKDVEATKWENDLLNQFPELFYMGKSGPDVIPEGFITLSANDKEKLCQLMSMAPPKASQHIAEILFDKIASIPHELRQAYMYNIEEPYQILLNINKTIEIEKEEARDDI